MSAIFKHIQLLLIHLFNGIQKNALFFSKLHINAFHKNLDMSEITPDIMKLLPDCLTKLLATAFTALCQCKIVLSCIFTIHSRLVVIVLLTDSVNYLFQLFA